MKRLLLILVVALALGGAFASKANAWTGSCWVGPQGSSYTYTCSSPWNYWVQHIVTNRSSAGWIYCDVYNLGGSISGGHGYVAPNSTVHFWAGGYNRISCEYDHGPWPIGVSMYSYT